MGKALVCCKQRSTAAGATPRHSSVSKRRAKRAAYTSRRPSGAHSPRSLRCSLRSAGRAIGARVPSSATRLCLTGICCRSSVRFDLYSLRHTFASLGRTAGESAFNVARIMGHAQSTLVDQVYAHSMQSGMATVAENVTARALKPLLRLIEGGQRDVRQPLLEEAMPGEGKSIACA